MVRNQLDRTTKAALETAFDAAQASRVRVVGPARLVEHGGHHGDGGGRAARADCPRHWAELPVTTTVLLRAIQGIAADHGFDAEDRQVRAQCMQIFADGRSAGAR